MKKIIFILTLIILIFSLGRNLNPSNKQMFESHDITQAARVQQFTLNLKSGHIPPRVAPDFNNSQGYPVFNFYAPTAYWISSLINLAGFDVVNSLKLSFLLAIIFSFIFSYLFLRSFFDFYPSIFGAVIYSTVLYLPADIFIRGNLAEVWFIALLPLSLYFIYQNSQKPKPVNFIIGTIALSLTFTSHNLLSMVFIPVSLLFALILKNKKNNLISFALALLLSGYFLIPFLLENHLTIAREMAAKTNYQDHFLCINQLWDSPWGYGGSIKGCNDGMPFKLGKLQIIFAVLGIVIFIINVFKKKKKPYLLTTSYLLLLLILSLFMTLYPSKFIWDLFSPILSVFQFPWRFISLSLIGIAFFSSLFWNTFKLPFKPLIIIIFASVTLFINTKYYHGKTIDKSTYEKKYLSKEFIEKKAAFLIPEYFNKNSQIKVKWGQTTIEQIGNLTTVFAFALLGIISFNELLWKKNKVLTN
jgi:hypothetical protein